MEHRQLGRSGLNLSVLGLGTAPFGKTEGGLAKWGRIELAEAKRMIALCLEAGVNWIDTSNAYSTGVSEQVCGEALQGIRDQLLVATKVRFRMGPGANDAGLSRQHIVAQAEASLRRLRTDHIDLYQVHQWDGLTPLEETLEALDTLVRSGKVRYIGCSNYSAWHLMKALAVSDSFRYQRFVSQQIHYTLEAREAEHELIPLAIDQGVGVLVWSPLAGGWLTGKFRRNQPLAPETRQGQEFREPPIHDEGRLYDIIETLVEIAEARGDSPAQVAIAWLLGRPAVSGIVLGARNEKQLVDNLGAASLDLSLEERARLERVSQRPLPYPYWHQAGFARDRLGAADLALLGPYL